MKEHSSTGKGCCYICPTFQHLCLLFLMPLWNVSVCFLLIRISEDLWLAGKLGFDCFICLNKGKKGQGKIGYYNEVDMCAKLWNLLMKKYFKRVKCTPILILCCIVIISQRTFLVHSSSVSISISGSMLEPGESDVPSPLGFQLSFELLVAQPFLENGF